MRRSKLCRALRMTRSLTSPRAPLDRSDLNDRLIPTAGHFKKRAPASPATPPQDKHLIFEIRCQDHRPYIPASKNAFSSPRAPPPTVTKKRARRAAPKHMTSRLCQTGIIRTSLGAILFGAFAQPNLANMYTIACVPPEQNHPKISCSEVRAVPRQPIFG